MKSGFFIICLAMLMDTEMYAQGKPFIKLVQPTRETTVVRASTQYISGSTCKSCVLTLNGKEVKVYSSGGFAAELKLQPGENNFTLLAKSGEASATKKLVYRYSVPTAPEVVKTLEIASITINPAGNMIAKPGDKIFFRVKALPRSEVWVADSVKLYEMPVTASNPVPGFYQGEYEFKVTDTFSNAYIQVRLRDSSGNTVSRRTPHKYTMLHTLPSDRIITKGRLAHLLYGIGEDRLGGAKIGYIDSLIPLRVTGKVNDLYRVQLTQYRSVYIPDDVVEFLPKGTPDARSLTGNWRVYGDSVFDYVKINLETRLPYQSMQELNPSRIVVDIFGATSNTNWITQLDNVKEISNVRYEQLEDEVLRVTIDLKHKQHWGHAIYYEGNRLVIRVKQQPQKLDLRNLVIAVDAGHGGGNSGATGPTGSIEKEMALAVSLKLKRALEYQGAKVIMTRTTEAFVDNKERILMYRDSLPDLLVSLHLNSSGDPINAKGTGTFYKYPGFRPFSYLIYKRMLELGLKDYGNTGNFNFMLNSPTEYPNALIEMLFISNPEEEDLILQESFQLKMAEKIVEGIKDFLKAAAEDHQQ
ncbi:MAG: N-acetylmuramoyl-L-alanine amidase [Chitinophagaceae bacterium]|nr:N-acetylmuramoyl-L-alanine amidase [Chitinophagaceae bacterium]